MPEARHPYKDSNGNVWKYISEKDMQALFPNGGFMIFSDLGKKKGCSDHILEGIGFTAAASAYKKKQSWFRYVIGYVPVTDGGQEDGFVRILGTAWYKLLIILFAVLVSLTIFIGGIWFAKQDEVPGLDKTAVSYHMDGVRNTDSTSIMLPGIHEINAKENEAHVKAALINPEGNDCYFKYIITLSDTDEMLYSSGLIAPGKAVMEFDLKRTLSVGEYPIRVRVETTDIKNLDIQYNAGNIDAQLKVTR